MTGQTKSDTKRRALLEGIRVLDFSVSLMAPVTTRLLAAYGAEVIKVESIRQHEITRVSAPYKDNLVGVNRSLIFNANNTGKYSITLNLKHPRSSEIINRLITWADVIVENFVPGAAKKFGLDYEHLQKAKPEVIVVDFSAQGLTGPYSKHPGYGFQILALTCFSQFTGWPDREPVAPVGSYTDFLCPPLAVCAILSALDHRRLTGRGQHIDLSQLEISPHFFIPAILDYSVNGRVQTRCGNRSPYASPHGAYRCRGDDRWCVIAVRNEKEWEAFCKVIGSPGWARDPKFSTLLGRKSNEDELDRLVEAWTVSFVPKEVMNRMQAAGVAAGIVQTTEEMVNDPQLKHREHFEISKHPEAGSIICENPAFHLSKCKARWPRPAPCLGEHNEFVYTKLLGIPDEEFAQLLNDGVFE